MNSFIERVVNYCKKISGQDMSIGVMNKRNLRRFPLTITDTYTCYDAVIMGVPVVLLEVHGDYTPMQLQKHQNVVTKLAGICSVFAIENVASYNLSRMIKARINFIVPDKQIYLPSLLINLKEVKDSRNLDDEVMPGMAQCVLLYQLQRGDLNGCTITDFSEKFNTSYASMSRALRWLKNKGLIEMVGGKEKVLSIDEMGKDLWEKAKPLLLSPVERVLYTDKVLDEMPFAGETALEKLTMIATNEKQCRAVSKPWAKKQEKELNRHYGEFKVEVWRYDPSLLSKDGIVDSLSLYLSLRDKEDERIQMEIDNLINNAL